MLKSPTAYNPRLHPSRSLKRRNVVLNNLVNNNYVSKEIGDSLKKIPLNLNYKNAGRYGDIAPYFLVQIEELGSKILKDLKKDNGESYYIYRDGLMSYTPINCQMQMNAIVAVEKQMRNLQSLYNRHFKSSRAYTKFVNREVEKSA